MTVCALKIAHSARKRILAAGGEVITFDQLALRAPKGTAFIQDKTLSFWEAPRAEKLWDTSDVPLVPRDPTPKLTLKPDTPRSPEEDENTFELYR